MRERGNPLAGEVIATGKLRYGSLPQLELKESGMSVSAEKNSHCRGAVP
jgi:hypothetical protein